MGDYYKKTVDGRISLGSQLANLVIFDIKNVVLTSLRGNQFDGSVIRDLWEHLTRFYETCLMHKPGGIIGDQIKLR